MLNDVIQTNIEPNAPVAIIFIGIQGSGKSTYYAQRIKKDFEHINLDTLKTRARESALLEHCLANGLSFVVDNTNPTQTDRLRYIERARAAGYRIVGYYFQSQLQGCIERNNLRSGKQKIPAKAIAATSNKLQLPSWDEGYDELYFVHISNNINPQTNQLDMITEQWRQADEL